MANSTATDVLLGQVEAEINRISTAPALPECGAVGCTAHPLMVQRAKSADVATKLTLQMLAAIYAREQEQNKAPFWATLPGTMTGSSMLFIIIAILAIAAKLLGVTLPKL